MAQHNCSTPNCEQQAFGRKLFCLKCWTKIPYNLQSTIRADTEKGQQTLRAKPSREWFSKAFAATRSN